MEMSAETFYLKGPAPVKYGEQLSPFITQDWSTFQRILNSSNIAESTITMQLDTMCNH